MPGSVDSASSTGRVIVRSTSVGVEPGYGMLTNRNGASRLGNCSSGRRMRRDQPDHDHRHEEHDRGDGTLQAELGDGHAGSPSGSAATSLPALRAASRTMALAARDVPGVAAHVEQVVDDRDHDQRQQRRHGETADHGRSPSARALRRLRRRRSPAARSRSACTASSSRSDAGAIRRPARSHRASATPSSRNWLTRSISTIAFLTTMPTSMMRPMNTTTETGELRELQRQHGADRGERDREHDHERMQQRFELRRHHQIDEEDREAQARTSATSPRNRALRSGRRRAP